jgi:hypothetical protein
MLAAIGAAAERGVGFAGENVWDMFGGSGSALSAAEQAGRRAWES